MRDRLLPAEYHRFYPGSPSPHSHRCCEVRWYAHMQQFAFQNPELRVLMSWTFPHGLFAPLPFALEWGLPCSSRAVGCTDTFANIVWREKAFSALLPWCQQVGAQNFCPEGQGFSTFFKQSSKQTSSPCPCPAPPGSEYVLVTTWLHDCPRCLRD